MAKFTRQHFEATAAVFRKQFEDLDGKDNGLSTQLQQETLRSTVIRIAAMFAGENLYFNSDSFFLASGLNKNGGLL